jgi:D-sedoheptulose 7-phosphate isomerase
MNPLHEYFQDHQKILDQFDRATLTAILEILEKARVEQRHIFVFGNGGSASTASHFAADLGKNTRRAHLPHFRVTCLNDNMALFSAFGNDEGYDSVFSEPLRSQARAGDVAIAISASGNSPNVVRAIQTANEMGLTTIGLAGFTGGKLQALAQHCIVISVHSYEHVEDLHLMVCHALVASIKQKYPALPS